MRTIAYYIFFIDFQPFKLASKEASNEAEALTTVASLLEIHRSELSNANHETSNETLILENAPQLVDVEAGNVASAAPAGSGNGQDGMSSETSSSGPSAPNLDETGSIRKSARISFFKNGRKISLGKIFFVLFRT